MTKDLMTFPHKLTLKVIGQNNIEFEGAVLGILKKHIPKLGEGAIESKPSKGNKYSSLNVALEVQSKEELDALMKELADHPLVIMVL